MEKNFLYRCKNSGINSESVLSERKKFVLVHEYLETGHVSIVAFADSILDLWDLISSHPRSCSSRHNFYIKHNIHDMLLYDIKDSCLINICKNVAEYLSVGEYAMFKKSYFKSASWFEKAKNAASLGAEILDNY